MHLRRTSPPIPIPNDTTAAIPLDAAAVDMVRITPRLFIASRPTMRPTNLVDDKRNNIDVLSAALTRAHGTDWLLWNLSSKTSADMSYPALGNAVIEWQPYSRGGLRDNTPALGQVLRFVHALAFWFAWGPTTVAVLTCDDGIMRSGFFAAACLAVSGGGGFAAALEKVSTIRLGAPAVLAAALPPSWRFLATGLDTLAALPRALPRSYALGHIVLRLPRLKAMLDGGAPNLPRVPRVQLWEAARLAWDSSDAGDEGAVRWEDGASLVCELPENVAICGDYALYAWSDGSAANAPFMRAAWHTSLCSAGAWELPGSACDIFKPEFADAATLGVTLLLSPLNASSHAALCVGRLASLGYLGLKYASPEQLFIGASIFTAHSHVFPEPKALAALLAEGCDETAAVAALQRANNQAGRAREYLDTDGLRAIFRESTRDREMGLLRATLSDDELALALAARFNVVVKTLGPRLEDLDMTALLEASKLGQMVPVGGAGAEGGGEGGGPGGGGGGGGGRNGRRHGVSGKTVRPDAANDSDAASLDGSGDKGSSGALSATAEAAIVAPLAVPGAVFANTGEANEPAGGEGVEEEEAEEDEKGGPWSMATHPIFGQWLKMIAAGRLKGELEAELSAAGWAAGRLLGFAGDAEVPAIPALTCALGAWATFAKFDKMLKMGMPKPIVEHALSKESLAPTLLDADRAAIPLATDISPPRKAGTVKKGPQCKHLHWVPIRGAIKGTAWAGPPGDLALAARQLFPDQAAFDVLFVQDPKTAKAKGKARVALLDPKRAMNAGIALARIKAPTATVRACLLGMTAFIGGVLLSRAELVALAALAPTEDECRAIRGFKGDVAKLGPVEAFFGVLADVPAVRLRAAALLLQADWDERLADARARAATLQGAAAQVKGSARFRRVLKSVLVLGNKLNSGE